MACEERSTYSHINEKDKKLDTEVCYCDNGKTRNRSSRVARRTYTEKEMYEIPDIFVLTPRHDVNLFSTVVIQLNSPQGFR